MCEETENYLWATQDVLGRGATSQVYKAYNKKTGELVAAKVYPVSSDSRSYNAANSRDYSRILDQEMRVLQNTNHENIIRYIGVEPVKLDDGSQRSTHEALLIEYCNGGSLHNVLELPENRYGLAEDEFMLVFGHLTQALRYLHDKNTIHRDIKPDNIMLSININGERTYKLADLGVARLINPNEIAFRTIVGTEEYIHPAIYRAAIPDKQTTVLPKTLESSNFPFEVDLWSFGVTIYQCATGELPFQPFAGTRKDQKVMRAILNSKPPGVISGIEKAPGTEICWSKTLPESCRLSPSLKYRLQLLLARLLESRFDHLMSFQEFFVETDRILSMKPIYYLNLKRFQVSCSYFEQTQSTIQLYDELIQQNGDQNNVEYYCLFQNVPYPISKTKPVSIKTFCEQLPIPTSRETPLVFYTFSPLRNDDSYVPVLYIPTIKTIRQKNDVAAAYDWAKDIVGLFFYIKGQLIEYQRISQTAQCSTTIMQQHLKSKLLEFLCSIRSKLIVFRAIEELKNILDQIDCNTSGQATPRSNSSNCLSTSTGSLGRTSANGEAPSIGFSHLLNNNNNRSNENIATGVQRPASISTPTQLIQQSIRIYMRSYLQPYEELKRCEQDIIEMIEQRLNNQMVTDDSEQPFSNTLWLADHTKIYSSWIQRTDKFLKDANDLFESFRQDRLLSSYNNLQVDSHFLRRRKFEELYEKFISFANTDCHNNLVKLFHDYNEWISRQAGMIRDFERIRQTYEKQCENIMSYVDMIDNIRTVVYKNIHDLSNAPMAQSTCEENPVPSSMPIGFERMQISGPNDANACGDDAQNPSHTNKAFISKIRGTTKRSIQNAEESLDKLDNVIKQLRTSIQKK